MAFEKAFHGMVIRFIARFPCDDPHDFAGVNRWGELLYIPHIGGHGLRIDMAFAAGMPRSLIDQAEHALHDEPAGFLPDHRPLYPGLPTAFGNRFGKEHNGTNDFVVVLNGVHALESGLCHRCAPYGGQNHRSPRPVGEAGQTLGGGGESARLYHH